MRKRKPLLIIFSWAFIAILFNLILKNVGWAEIPVENPEYPGAIWVGADTGDFSSVVDRKIARIIIHATGSTYGEAKNWFQNPSAEVSAHYVIDQDGKIYQFVLEKDKAWHAGKDYNPTTIGIELVSGHSESFDKPSYLYNHNWVTSEIYRSAADLVKYLCQKYNIPMDRKYIIGHSEIIPNPKGKVDPGPYWDWVNFMNLVKNNVSGKGTLDYIIGAMSQICHIITTACDPNELLVSPEGDIKLGGKLDYTINYENEGEGIAYGVYITDTLEEDLDDSTLVINNNGTYDFKTRTIKWFINEVQSKQQGSVSFSINVNQTVVDKAEVINFATVYFPSVPEETRTNGTVNKITTATDIIPPVTIVITSPAANSSGWNNSDVTLTLSTTDNEGGSGVAKTEYSLDNTNWLAYIEPFIISTEGTTTVFYKSTDNASNIEQAKSIEIRIDKTPPVITAIVSPQPNSAGWNNTDTTVSFAASDSLSGIASVTELQIISTEGKNQIIGGEAIDFAGNTVSTSVTLNIDKTQPIITTEFLPQPNNNGWNNADVAVSFNTQDSLSGIRTVTSPITVVTEGANQKFTGEAIDYADNKATTSITLNIDKTPPALNIIATPNILWPPNHKLISVTIGGESKDNLSGIDLTTFKLTDEYKTMESVIPGFNSIIQLESWREGNDLDGRVYTILATTKDKADNQAIASITVICPHDQGKK